MGEGGKGSKSLVNAAKGTFRGKKKKKRGVNGQGGGTEEIKSAMCTTDKKV